MRQNISISLDTQTLDSIEKNRRLITVSRFIEECVLEFLDKKKELATQRVRSNVHRNRRTSS